MVAKEYVCKRCGNKRDMSWRIEMTSEVYPGDVIQPKDYNEGWVAGAGVEYKLSDKLGLKFEALYHDFGSETYEQFDSGDPMESSHSVMTARIGYTYRF